MPLQKQSVQILIFSVILFGALLLTNVVTKGYSETGEEDLSEIIEMVDTSTAKPNGNLPTENGTVRANSSATEEVVEDKERTEIDPPNYAMSPKNLKILAIFEQELYEYFLRIYLTYYKDVKSISMEIIVL